MPHDKIKAAIRRRMAQTGEPYAVARRAVLAEQKLARQKRAEQKPAKRQGDAGQDPATAEGYALTMSSEVREWLTGLGDSEPAAALVVRLAIAALMNEGARLGEPVVVSAPGSWGPALVEGLERSYREQAERLAVVRGGQADAIVLARDIRQLAAYLESAQLELRKLSERALDAGRAEEAERVAGALDTAWQLEAELRRLLPKVVEAAHRLAADLHVRQPRVGAFRTRKDLLKAKYTSAQLTLQALEGIIAASPGRQETAEASRDAEATLLRDAIAEMERELGQQPWPDELMELRPVGPGDSAIRMLFAVEPPGTALLIAVLDGPEAVRDRYLEAVLLSADRLRQVRAGQAPEASVHRYDNASRFLTDCNLGEKPAEE